MLSLTDVLFGDVHICGGQSNMQFTLAQIGQQDGYDAAAEIAKADGYPHIRTMTVGRTTASYQPLPELRSAPTLPWSAASSKTIGQGIWTAVRILTRAPHSTGRSHVLRARRLAHRPLQNRLSSVPWCFG